MAHLWKPQASEASDLTPRTTLSSRGSDPFQIKAPSHGPRTLTPDEIYNFHTQPKPLEPKPWTTSDSGRRKQPLQNMPPATATLKPAAATLGEAARSSSPARTARASSPASTSTMLDPLYIRQQQLRAEADDLQRLMDMYEEQPSPAHRTQPERVVTSARNRPTVSSKGWQRPVGLAAPVGMRSQQSTFASRETTLRTGSLGLGALQSRFNAPSPRQPPPPGAPPLLVPAAATAGTDALAMLARSAAAAGVVPPFPQSSSGGAAAAAGGGMSAVGSKQPTPADFQSPAVRFAVALAETLESLDERHHNRPSSDGCRTCLATLREMVPLLGPLGTVLQTVHDALELCTLSEQPSTDSLAASLAAAAQPRPTEALTDRLTATYPPTSASVSADERERVTLAAAATAAAAASSTTGSPPFTRFSSAPPGVTVRAASAPPASAPTEYVPYFVLVRKLEEEASALQSERDKALDEIERNGEDLSALDEQLATAKEQLTAKTKTIDKLVREHTLLEAELRGVRETLKASEHKYEVLQTEAAAMNKDFMGETQRLEEEVERLRMLNSQQMSSFT